MTGIKESDIEKIAPTWATHYEKLKSGNIVFENNTYECWMIDGVMTEKTTKPDWNRGGAMGNKIV